MDIVLNADGFDDTCIGVGMDETLPGFAAKVRVELGLADDTVFDLRIRRGDEGNHLLRTDDDLRELSDGTAVNVVLRRQPVCREAGVDSWLHAAVSRGARSMEDIESGLNEAESTGGLDAVVTLIGAPGERGLTPLQIAAQLRDEELVAALVRRGAEIDATSVEGETALHFAAQSGGLAIARLLLDTGAFPSTPSKDGRTPLHHSCLVDTDMLSLLIAEGADTEHPDNEGNTPLHRAVVMGSATAVCKLLDHGADVHAVNNRGETALFLSVSKYEVLCALRDRGAGQDVNRLTIARSAPLHEAASFATARCVEELISLGAEVSAVDGSRMTPLDLAAQRRSPAVGSVLVKAGADPLVKGIDRMPIDWCKMVKEHQLVKDNKQSLKQRCVIA